MKRKTTPFASTTRCTVLLTCTWLLAAGFLSPAISQEKKSKFRKSIRGEFQLVSPLQNRAFKNHFSGVFNTGLSMNWGKKHFSAGVYYSMMQFQIFPEFKKGTIDDPHTIQTSHSGGLKFSWDMLTSSGKGMWSPFIAPGYSFITYSRIKCKDQLPQETQVQAFSLNAGITYNIMLDEWVGVGFIAGYNGIDHVFHPYNICLTEWYTFEPDDARGGMQNIVFGFCFYFDLDYKPETSDE